MNKQLKYKREKPRKICPHANERKMRGTSGNWKMPQLFEFENQKKKKKERERGQ